VKQRGQKAEANEAEANTEADADAAPDSKAA